jgi:uncharacterized membrane protein (DUF373 family)
MNVNRKTSFQILLDEWRLLNFYGRFEQVVALILSAVIAVIIVVSLIQLIGAVFTLLIMGGFNPIDHRIFQSVFGMVMNLLIAMEFKHSIVRVALRQDNIIQVKTVLLIALIALARKFVILDPEVGAEKIAALAATTVALGLTYWLLRERDDRTSPESLPQVLHAITRFLRARDRVATPSLTQLNKIVSRLCCLAVLSIWDE